MLKRSICAVMMAAAALGLCACGNGKTAPAAPAEAQAPAAVERSTATKAPAVAEAPAEAEEQVCAGTYVVEKAAFPCVAVHVESNALLYYISVPQKLADALNERSPYIP